MTRWSSDYEQTHPVRVNYRPIGSGGGIDEMKKGWLGLPPRTRLSAMTSSRKCRRWFRCRPALAPSVSSTICQPSLPL